VAEPRQMHHPQHQNMAVELALLALLATLWGASYTFIKLGVATIPPITLIAARTSIAGLLLLAIMRWRGLEMPRDAATWRRFLFQACLNSVIPWNWAGQILVADFRDRACHLAFRLFIQFNDGQAGTWRHEAEQAQEFSQAHRLMARDGKRQEEGEDRRGGIEDGSRAQRRGNARPRRSGVSAA
jgi:hypothetical protein